MNMAKFLIYNKNKEIFMKKKILTFIFSLVLILPLSLLLFACGGDSGKKISSIMINNYDVSLEYGQPIEGDPFGIELSFSDGTRAMLEDMTQEEVDELDLQIILQKQKEHIPVEGEDSWETEWEDWSFEYEMPVAWYQLTLKSGRVQAVTNFNIVPTDYPNNVSVFISNNITYGDPVALPSVSLNTDMINYINYYYQEKTEDNTYADREQWQSYNYGEGENCYILPGTYQMFAEIFARNYTPILTTLRTFTVQKATKTNFALFTSSYNSLEDKYEYTRVTSPITLIYEVDRSNIFDYIPYAGIEICATNENGEVAYDEYGYTEFTQSLQYLIDNGNVTLTSENTVIDQAKQYNVAFRFTPNADLYKDIPLNFIIKIEKNVTDLPGSVSIKTGNSSSADTIYYDGEEHYIDVNEYYYYNDNGVYYGVKKTEQQIPEEIEIDDETNHGTHVVKIEKRMEWDENEQANVERWYRIDIIKIYTFTNFANTDAGTYKVSCTLLPEWNSLVVLRALIYNQETGEYEQPTGSHLEIGSYTINKKPYIVEADLLIDGNSQLGLVDPQTGYTTLVYNKTYTITANNMQVFDNSGSERQLDTTVEARIKELKVYSNHEGGFVTEGVITNGNKITFTEDSLVNTTLLIYVVFTFDNENYNEPEQTLFATIKSAVRYFDIKAKVINEEDSYVLNYRQIDYFNADERDVTYFSADNNTYRLWNDYYDTLYYTYGSNEEYQLNTSNTINANYNYYIKNGENNYSRVNFYILDYRSVKENESARGNENVVYYDGLNKKIELGSIQFGIDINAEKFSDIYESLYIISWEDDQTVYTQNTSNQIDFSKTYYKQVDSDVYVEQYIYYKVENRYIQTRTAIDGVSEYYVCFNDIDVYAEYLEVELQNFADIYNTLYIGQYDEETYQTEYTANTSNQIDFAKNYYTVDQNGFYQYMYVYYKVGDIYYRTEAAVDGVTDYYLFGESRIYTRNHIIEKYDEVNDTWVKAENTKDVGLYRKYYWVGAGNCVLVDEDGNYLFEIPYEWEVRKTGLTPVAVVGDPVITFTDTNGNELTINDNTITVTSEDVPVYLNITVTLDNVNVKYKVVLKMEDTNNYGSYTTGTTVGAYQASTYHVTVYIVLDENHYLADSQGNGLEYLAEFDWQLVIAD